MKSSFKFLDGGRQTALMVCALIFVAGLGNGSAQVSPAEILNPQLRAAESTYLRQLQTYNRAIQLMKFPFPFYLTRYVDRDPQKQVETDTRGLEFVKFHDRIVLKITGVYSASYDAARLTQNQRADRTFSDIVVPILEILPQQIPADVKCDEIGFEISYHVRTKNKSFDYEGKENLVVVFDKADAFGYSQLSRQSQRQEVVNRSEIYVNGKEFGLALGEKEAISAEALDRSNSHESPARKEIVATPNDVTPNSGPPGIDRNLPPGYHIPDRKPTDRLGPSSPAAENSPDLSNTSTGVVPAGTATQADADTLQAKYQPQLDALAKDGAAQYHFVDYAPPSFVVFRGKIFMQVTMRNSFNFEKETTSIYKRAAQGFDLFLAPQLKPLMEKVPADAQIEGLDISVLNQLGASPKPSSEAVEYICPLKPLRQFVEAGITNQDLINQSTILVNGVRIALDLQRVE